MANSTNRPSPPTEAADFAERSPFADMCIADNRHLAELPERQPCPRCHASRRFFCYSCYLQLPDVPAFPEVRLPIRIDIIKHRKEVDGKSTSAHARLLAPHHCHIYHYPDIPDYAADEAANGGGGIVLIYPSANSNTVGSLFGGGERLDADDNFGLPAGFNIGTLLRWRLDERTTGAGDGGQPNDDDDKRSQPAAADRRRDSLPIRRAVFIDSTWNQSRSIYKDARIRRLPTVVLQNRLSQFWRHQKGSPRWFLSTVEAVHQLLLELHVHAWGLARGYRGLERLELGGATFGTAAGRERLRRRGDERLAAQPDGADGADELMRRPYAGQYDNLLFLFAHMYGLIHRHYDHSRLQAYKRPIK